MYILRYLLLSVIALVGLGTTLAGGWLFYLGGTIYYVIFGIMFLISFYLLIKRRNKAAIFLIGSALVYTFIWAIYERGFTYWPMFSRLLAPLGITIASCFIIAVLDKNLRFKLNILGSILLITFVVFFGFAFTPHDTIYGVPSTINTDENNTPENWSAYGKTTEGTRYSHFTQINKDNVKNLKVAWTYHTGRTQSIDAADQNTPLQIGDLIYTCTPENVITALDADSGKEVWKHNTQAKSPIWNRCRSVSFYKSTQLAPNTQCSERIIATTIDARLIALDSKTGKACQSFGQNGVVDLKQGMGEVKPGFYFQTSAPLVARNHIVIGGWVVDNQEVNEPSGVIRSFNAETGDLQWAWDLADPSITKLPPDGKEYTRGTPNMWTHAAFDDKLGLVYIPLGNTTPDFFGGNRPKFADQYNSSLVALDVNTGRERWKFQTVHHDIWDYDLPSQPALVDVPDDSGKIVPGIMQTTKRGQIFLLNRENGKPISKVEEKPVPNKSNIAGEYLSSTQPYSTGMPTIGAERLEEKKLWGMTMFDQLACRIQFKNLVYQGDFTPIDSKPTIFQPGNLGGMNWGSVSVDKNTNIAYVNDIRVPALAWLVQHDKYEEVTKNLEGNHSGPMRGTPYGGVIINWMTKLGVPCSEPPYGTVTAVNLNTRKVQWQVPAGTAETLGPLGIKSHLPMPIGMPTYAGTSVTAGGLVFFAGFQDYYIRAYDSATGKEVWKYPLPVGSSATPMTYISPKTGKQYILLSVGGAAHSPDMSDQVIAFSLK